MERCAWVTRSRPDWGERLPWYLVDRPPEERRYFVLGGAVTERPVPEGGTDYFDVASFPAQRWSGTSCGAGPAGLKARLQGRRDVLEDHCSRLAAVPPFAEVWSEAEWRRSRASAGR